MVMPHGEAAGGASGETSEIRAHSPADRFQCLELGDVPRSVDADAFGGALVDRDEHRHLALAGDRRGQVGSPHRIHGIGNDGAVMAARVARRSNL